MADKLNLLMITHNYPRFKGDFAGVFISLLARKLLDYDIQPVVIAPHDKGLKEYEVIDGVKIYRFRYHVKEAFETIAYRGNMHKLVLGSVSGIFKFKRFLDCFRKSALDVIEKEKIDIIAGHWLIPAGNVMKTIAQKKNIPMILSSHGTDIRLMSRYFRVTYRFFEKFCLKLKRWTVVSSYLKDNIVSLDPRLENILEVLPMPHDETVFYVDDTIQREENLIVAVTRFTEQKRVNYLVNAFALVSEMNPDAVLEIYGKGPLQEQIEQQIMKLGLGEKVKIFHPIPQEALRVVYNRATMVILNSFEDGFGLALSEAMLCGAGVIGTDSGGVKDIIRHNENGLLVELDNSQQLAEAILSLLNNKTMREKLSNRGNTFARNNYASAALAGRYAEIVKKALE